MNSAARRRLLMPLAFTLFATALPAHILRADDKARVTDTRPNADLKLPATAPSTRPIPSIERVMIISIDGLRPDLMLRASTPVMHGLLDRGSYTLWARTIPIAITLPSHTSMLTGVGMEKHGIDWNADVPPEMLRYPKVPTIFDVAHQYGYSTAMVTGKSKFLALARPGAIDHVVLPDTPKGTDADVAKGAAEVIRKYRPQVMFVHFPGVDTAGHAKGWASDEQMATIEKVDAGVGQVLAAMNDAKLSDSTLLIVSADHGGAGGGHGAGDARSLHIPWIAVGPGIRKGYDLTRVRDLNVNTVDTFATACYVMGIRLPEGCEGKPVQPIFERAELIKEIGK